ncbi:type III [Chlorella sorokiniana]|uniref:Type III n=1 Tax=Chlorella sorokiniana TaxID=3076 RepID=A0A2P6TR67_CHLSO|nr:type III [Chlorella sorokiniana]|eukprot:PRW56551.1 type III [Chlorella sorokiniana]
MARWRRLARALAASALLLCFCAAVAHGSSEQQRQRAAEQLFQQLDANKDGEVTAAETAHYVDQDAGFDWLAQEGWSVAAAAQHSQQALDGADAGGTVSKAELAAHLRALLQDHRVVDWVEHGLGLPQYAAAFKRNAVTALDFPLLLSDGGATLAADLGVTSRLHQQQILRGLKRLVLGLGQLPAPPQQLECAAVNKSATSQQQQQAADRLMGR